MENIEELKYEEKFQKKFLKGFILFLSEFSFMIIAAIIALIGIIFPKYCETTEYTSNESLFWNSSSDPLILTHLSDIHVSNLKGIDYYRPLFRTMKKLGANIHLLTGDLVDSYEKKSFPKVGKQVPKDFELYTELMETELYNETIIDVSGNHDLFGTISPFDNDLGLLDISKTFKRNNTKTLEDFWIKTINKEGMNFILLNSYKFPMVHPPYIYYTHPEKKLLDLLEQEINKNNPCSILSHYPTDFFGSEKSSNGNNFETLMKNKNIQYIFTGHSHPSKFQINHHEYGGIEFIGTAIKKTKDFGLVTIDNGELVYHKVDYSENNFRSYYMTFPVPKEQLSKSNNFNNKNIEVRIISYKKEIEDNLYISGDFSGKLNYQRDLKNGAKLYSLPLDIKNDGEYKINFKANDFEITRQFYVGKKIKIEGEKRHFFYYFLKPFIAAIIFLLVFLLIITFPIRIINLSFIDDWISGDTKGKWFYWVIIIFLSPFILNYRICTNSPLSFRIILFCFFCYPLVLPVQFLAPIKGHVGYSFLCYILIKKTILYDEWALFFTALYYLLIISPMVIAISGFKFKKSCFFIFHFVFLYAAFIAACYINFRYAGESVNFGLLFIHPCYVILPIILNVFMYLYLRRFNKELKLKENEKMFDGDNMNIFNSDITDSKVNNQ